MKSPELHYAIIETVPCSGTSTYIEKGLLRWFEREKKEGVAGSYNILVLKKVNGAVKSCNLMYYTILSIETFDGKTKDFTFFTQEDADQEAACDIISEVFNKFGSITNGKFIDTDQMIDIPKDFCTARSMSDNSPYSRNQKTINQQSFYGTSTSGGYKREEPKPFSFKRETNKPTESVLKELNAKLDLMAAGEYREKIVKIEGDEKTDTMSEYYNQSLAP